MLPGKIRNVNGSMQQDQQVVVFGVELRVADEEAQRELLVDAQEDGGRRRDDQQPAPDPRELAHARDLALDRRGCGVRIVELDRWRRGAAAAGRAPHAGFVWKQATRALLIARVAGLDARRRELPAPAAHAPARTAGYSNTGSMPAAGQRRLARRHPALGEGVLVVGRVALQERGPRRGQRLLALQELLVVRLVLGLPDARLLQRLHGPLVVGQHPGQVLALDLEAGGARRGVLVGVVVDDHRLGEAVDEIGRLRRRRP